MDEHGGKSRSPGWYGGGYVNGYYTDVWKLACSKAELFKFITAKKFRGYETPFKEKFGDVQGIGKEQGPAQEKLVQEHQCIETYESVDYVGCGSTVDANIANGNQWLVTITFLRAALRACAPKPVYPVTLRLRSHLAKGVKEVAVFRHSLLDVTDGSLSVQDQHRALGALAVGFQRLVGLGHTAVGIRWQREGDTSWPLVALRVNSGASLPGVNATDILL